MKTEELVGAIVAVLGALFLISKRKEIGRAGIPVEVEKPTMLDIGIPITTDLYKPTMPPTDVLSDLLGEVRIVKGLKETKEKYTGDVVKALLGKTKVLYGNGGTKKARPELFDPYRGYEQGVAWGGKRSLADPYGDI